MANTFQISVTAVITYIIFQRWILKIPAVDWLTDHVAKCINWATGYGFRVGKETDFRPSARAPDKEGE